MDMSIPYETTGRTNQKARTREAMVAAARAFLAEGVTPTVEQVAERAAISRTTAYRYFQNQRSLMLASYPGFDAPSLLGEDVPEDPADRVELVVEAMTRQVLEREPELRAMLRLSLETPAPEPEALPFRQGRAIRWIEEALSPLAARIPGSQLHRLALAIRATTGIEALVWLKDVGGLSGEEAIDLMRSSARALLRSALADAAPDGGAG